MLQRVDILEIFVSLSTFEMNSVLRWRQDRITKHGWFSAIRKHSPLIEKYV